MEKLNTKDFNHLIKTVKEYGIEFAVPLGVMQFYWDDLPEGCLAKYYEPDKIVLPLWFKEIETSRAGDTEVEDWQDFLPTIGHEAFHFRQFVDNPIGYKFAKNRLFARWTIEPGAFKEEKRIRALIGRDEHNQDQYG